MPNHITNIISFKGSEENIEKLKNSIQTIDENGGMEFIDFNKIVPKPASLEITSGSRVNQGLAILLFREKNDPDKLTKILNYAWVKAENITTLEELADFLIKEDRVDLDVARIALDNLEKYGFPDWFSWSIEKWGTKWNAYNSNEKDDGIYFLTAWSPPLPVIQKLSELFPEVEITIKFADGDFGCNCGEIIFLDGNIFKENIPKDNSLEAMILSVNILGNELNELMYYNCNEDEEFISGLVSAMIELFSPEEVVEEFEDADLESVSDIFLTTLKQELIDRECYEVIGRVDKKISELKKEGEI